MVKSPRSLDALVEHQVRKWSTERKRVPTVVGTPRRWPVVTISREYGSRGSTIGRLLAERLGFDFWDKKLVQAIAEDAGASQRVIETLDEQRKNAFADILASFVGGHGLSAGEYFERLGRVAQVIADHGSAVIVGRGANYLVPADRVLRLRVVAPVEVRVKGLMERGGLDEKTARSELRLVESERALFIKQAYNRDVADPMHYDLVINTGTLGVEAAVDVAVAAYKARFGALPV
ncbi:MAG: hypothetical protein CVU56_13315 [Deltaproteobacteria bacterium HGW-Deltaproteobacteria-14]|jgi:cytidylate kinase|nr:MAG: hypothetical protein CVU56_13315 [Deltaproteobacteria bacterium HGW-Deltaproteobacteria-14]